MKFLFKTFVFVFTLCFIVVSCKDPVADTPKNTDNEQTENPTIPTTPTGPKKVVSADVVYERHYIPYNNSYVAWDINNYNNLSDKDILSEAALKYLNDQNKKATITFEDGKTKKVPIHWIMAEEPKYDSGSSGDEHIRSCKFKSAIPAETSE